MKLYTTTRRSTTTVVAVLAAALIAIFVTDGALALTPSKPSQQSSMVKAAVSGGAFDRRTAFAALGTTSVALLRTTEASATTATTTAGPEAFVGTFTDPINHPGGKRTIRLLPEKENSLGDYRLAEVQGGGGRGEPASYLLPAVVLGGRTIIIDFSPKGGPRDFVGTLDPKTGDILFARDGNRWPRQ